MALEQPKNTGIYAIRCNATGRMYIGMSSHIVERVDTHLQELRRNGHTNPQLQADFNEYGEKNFSFFVLEEGLTDKEGRLREQDYMDEYDTRDPVHGYNCKHPRYGIKQWPKLIYEKPPKNYDSAAKMKESRP